MAETSRVDSIREQLKAVGQLHLLTFHDDLSFQEQEALLDQLHGIDFDHVQRIVAEASPVDPLLALLPVFLHSSSYSISYITELMQLNKSDEVMPPVPAGP